MRALIPYKYNAIANIVFNLLGALFSLFSLAFMIPFLGVLFGTAQPASAPVEWSFNAEAIEHNVYYYLGLGVEAWGASAALIAVIGLVLAGSLLKNLFVYFALWQLAPIRHGVVRDLRNQLMDKIVSLPMGYYSEERKGDIISKMTHDVYEVEGSVIRSLEMFFKEPIVILVHLTGLLIISARLTLFVFLLLPISGFLIGRLSKNLRHQSGQTQDRLGQLLSVVEETLGGLRIIKAFRAEDRVRSSFDAVNSGYMRMVMRVDRRRDLASPLSEFLGTCVMGVVLWFGGRLVLGEVAHLSPEALVGFMGLFYMILNPAKSFSSAYFNIQKGMASYDRISTILHAENPIKDPEKPVKLGEFKDAICYEGVTFSYGSGGNVLEDVDLTIRRGQTVAVVGPSGAGKTTLADLLPRFYDVTGGRITIDGVDIRSIRVKELRGLMGLVNQDPILFNDSFFNNIAFGVENATLEQVREAARIADADEFIMRTPEGYQTRVGDRGSKLSGGQRQRISIARAILQNPPIMILDEATSALDNHAEREVQRALENLMSNRTSIVIAHRLSTVQRADLICVLDSGRIREMGRHKELLARNGLYASLYREGALLAMEDSVGEA